MPKKIEVILAMRDGLSKSVDRAKAKMIMFGKSVKNVTRQIFNLRNAIVVLALYKIGESFVKAASKLEMFRMQLQAISKTAAEAEQKLSAIREFARTSPLETEDVIQSYVQLRAVGIDPTIKQLRTLGGVALLFNRKMLEVLPALIGLNKRTLRKVGIEISRTKTQAIIASGDIRKVVVNDSASVRQAIIETWEERFPGALERASDTFVAQMAIMRSNIWEFQAKIGSVFLPQIKAIVKSFGDFVGSQNNEIQKYAAVLLGVIATIRTAWNSLTIALRYVLTAVTQTIVAFVALGKAADKAFMAIVNNFKAYGNTILRAIKEKRFDLGTIFFEEFKKVDYGAIFGELAAGFKTIDAIGANSRKRTIKDVTDIKNAWKAVSDVLKIQAAPPELGLGGTGTMGADMGAAGGSDRAKRMRIRNEIKILKERLEANKMFQQLIIGNIKNAGKRELALIDMREAEGLAKIASWEEKGVISHQRYEEMKSEITRKASEERRQLTIDGLNKIHSASNALMSNIIGLMQQKRMQAFNNAKAEINAMDISEERKKELLKKAEAENRKRAKKEKALSIIMATVNTAVAVSKALSSTWPPLNFILAALVGAAGAVQIATIASQKLARGTSHARGGSYIVGEEGPERVTLPPGARVHTAAMTRNSIGAVSISPTIIINGNATGETVSQIRDTLDDFSQNFTQAMRRGYIQPKQLGFQMS